MNDEKFLGNFGIKKKGKVDSSFLFYYLVHSLFVDGYTVSDVVMFWRETPVVGVEDAELPQVTFFFF